MKLSVAVTTFNRYEWTIRSIEGIIGDERIDDVVIMDDASTDGSFEKLRNFYSRNEQVRTIRQLKNRGMSVNKRDAIAHAVNPYVLIADSDNIFYKNYLDAIFIQQPLLSKVIYCPVKGNPGLDYTRFQGIAIDKGNIKSFIDLPYFAALENTSNYVVNRDFFLKVWEENKTVKGIDTHWHLYNHLKNDGQIFVVPGCTYTHTVHPGSEWLKDVEYNMRQYKEIDELIKAL